MRCCRSGTRQALGEAATLVAEPSRRFRRRNAASRRMLQGIERDPGGRDCRAKLSQLRAQRPWCGWSGLARPTTRFEPYFHAPACGSAVLNPAWHRSGPHEAPPAAGLGHRDSSGKGHGRRSFGAPLVRRREWSTRRHNGAPRQVTRGPAPKPNSICRRAWYADGPGRGPQWTDDEARHAGQAHAARRWRLAGRRPAARRRPISHRWPAGGLCRCRDRTRAAAGGAEARCIESPRLRLRGLE